LGDKRRLQRPETTQRYGVTSHHKSQYDPDYHGRQIAGETLLYVESLPFLNVCTVKKGIYLVKTTFQCLCGSGQNKVTAEREANSGTTLVTNEINIYVLEFLEFDWQADSDKASAPPFGVDLLEPLVFLSLFDDAEGCKE